MVLRIGDKDAIAEIAIVFVHGLGGSKETWEEFSEMLEQKWTRNTPIDLLYIVHTPEDKKGILGKVLFNTSDIYRLSNFLKNYINESCKDHKIILLVGHSMGGLISRRYSVDNMDDENFKITDIVTYATPHKGSLIANLLIGFISLILLTPIVFCFLYFSLVNLLIAIGIDILLSIIIYLISNPQFRQLALRSRFIKKLNLDWTIKQVYNKINFITVAGGRDWVVHLKSSTDENDITLKIDEGKSHFTILKPVDINDYSLSILYNIIKERINVILSDDIIEDEDEVNGDDKPPF
jgi:hypothetical protein